MIYKVGMQPVAPVPAHGDPLQSPAASSHNISLRPYSSLLFSSLFLPRFILRLRFFQDLRIPRHHYTLCIPGLSTPPCYTGKHYNAVRLWILYTTWRIFPREPSFTISYSPSPVSIFALSFLVLFHFLFSYC